MSEGYAGFKERQTQNRVHDLERTIAAQDATIAALVEALEQIVAHDNLDDPDDFEECMGEMAETARAALKPLSDEWKLPRR